VAKISFGIGHHQGAGQEEYKRIPLDPHLPGCGWWSGTTWSRLTSFPQAGRRRRSVGARYSRRTWSRRTSIRLAPDSAANADGDRGRLPFGTASSVSDNRPASSVSRGLELDTRSRVKSLRSRSADSVPVTSTATAVHAADAADAAASSVKDTGCRRRDGYVSVSRHHYSSERASTRGWGSGRNGCFISLLSNIQCLFLMKNAG